MQLAGYLTWSFAHLSCLLLMLLCAFGSGNVLLKRWRFDSLAERLVFTTALGLGLCATVLFVVGLFGLIYRPVIWGLTVTGAIITCLCSWYSNKSQSSNRHIPEPSHEPSESKDKEKARSARFFTKRRVVIGLLLILTLCYCGALLITAQYPPMLWDSIAEHLVVTREFLAHHGPVAMLGIPVPVLPALNHTLFTWALALEDDILAQMVEQTFSILTAIGIYARGKRQDQPALGYAAAILWLSHPLVHLISEAAYVDLGLACFVFLGIYALRIFWDARQIRWWYLGMAMLAMGAGVKLAGLFFLAIGSLLGLWVSLRTYTDSIKRAGPEQPGVAESRFTLKPLIVGGALALLILIPWYGFVAYHSGNPFWPVLAQYSKGIWGAPSVSMALSNLSRFGGQPTLARFLSLPVDWLRNPERYNAELFQTWFPLIVIWPLTWIVAIFNRSVRWWTLWALAYTVFWFLEAPILRYWLIALPIVGLALCESIQWILERIRRPNNSFSAVWVSAGVLLLLWNALTPYYEIKGKGLPPATPEDRERYLSVLGGYLGARYVNAHTKPDDVVCVFAAPWLNYYFNRPVIDLRGALSPYRRPAFSWPDDQGLIEWLESENANWIFIYYNDPSVPKQNPVLDPFWPGYRVDYADNLVWVFHREP